jgi:hypothetical protein
MTVGPSESDVVGFLRAALAKQARTVPELEANARAAGLLKERQGISNASPFRRAKESLRIRSRRVGFGARSHCVWALPREHEPNQRPIGDHRITDASQRPTSATSAKPSAQPTSKARCETAPPRRIPSEWVHGIRHSVPRVLRVPCPTAVME